MEKDDNDIDNSVCVAAKCLKFNVNDDVTRAIKESMPKIDK